MFDEGVSIIVPAYNASSFIRECLDSAIKSGFPKIELIVVNDGSSDNTQELALSVPCPHECSVKVLNQSNKGVGVARNNGLRNATCPWIMFLDADDLLLPNIFQKIKNLPDDGDAYIFSFFHSRKREFEECCSCDVKRVVSFEGEQLCSLTQWTLGHLDEPALSGFNFSSSCATIYKKDTLDAGCIGFPKGVKNGEDLLFRMDFFEKCKKCYCVEYPIYLYYNNPNSVTNRYKPDISDITQAFFGCLKPFIDNRPELTPQYLRAAANNFFLEMDHFLFHKDNPFSIKGKYNVFCGLLEKEIYQEAFSVRDEYWTRGTIIKRIVYWALTARYYKLVFLFYLVKYVMKKMIR